MASNIVDHSIKVSLKMLDDGAETSSILSELAQAAEKIAGSDSVSSILLVNNKGLLTNGASPRLPKDYLNAIDGLQPDPLIGTCAAAAATGEMVITEDFSADNKWAELRHLPLALGFTGAWSMPIKNKAGKVLGTFGTYFREKRTPSKEEIESIRLLAETAAKVLERKKTAEKKLI